MLRAFVLLCLLSAARAGEKFGPYAGPGFPVLASTVDFAGWERPGFPKNNIPAIFDGGAGCHAG